MSEFIGQRVPDSGGSEREGALSEGFCTCPWNTEQSGVSSRTKISGRSVYREEVSQVARREIREKRVAQGGKFIVNTGSYGQPVERFENGCDMITLAGSRDKFSGRVLHFLKFI